jgi:hypothetical protein
MRTLRFPQSVPAKLDNLDQTSAIRRPARIRFENGGQPKVRAFWSVIVSLGASTRLSMSQESESLFKHVRKKNYNLRG